MKKRIILMLLTVVMCYGFLSAGKIIVLTPNGGENLTQNSTYFIKWRSSGIQKGLKLTLWRNNRLIGVIATNINANLKAYKWQVGLFRGGLANIGSGYKIKIKEMKSTVSDMSNSQFSISKPGGIMRADNLNQQGTVSIVQPQLQVKLKNYIKPIKPEINLFQVMDEYLTVDRDTNVYFRYEVKNGETAFLKNLNTGEMSKPINLKIKPKGTINGFVKDKTTIFELIVKDKTGSDIKDRAKVNVDTALRIDTFWFLDPAQSRIDLDNWVRYQTRIRFATKNARQVIIYDEYSRFSKRFDFSKSFENGQKGLLMIPQDIRRPMKLILTAQDKNGKSIGSKPLEIKIKGWSGKYQKGIRKFKIARNWRLTQIHTDCWLEIMGAKSILLEAKVQGEDKVVLLKRNFDKYFLFKHESKPIFKYKSGKKSLFTLTVTYWDQKKPDREVNGYH